MKRTATTPPPATSAIGPSPLVVGRTLGTVVVTVHGDLDGSISSYLSAVLGDLIEGQGNQAVVVDLPDMRRLDQAAVAALSTAAQSSDRGRGRLALRRPTAHVAEVLATAGLAGLVVDDGSELRPKPSGPLAPGRPDRPSYASTRPATASAPILNTGGNP